MLDIHAARTIRNAINHHFDKDGEGTEFIDLESVCRMQPIPFGTKAGGCNIFGTQYGDLTILVWVQISQIEGITVRAVKTQSW